MSGSEVGAARCTVSRTDTEHDASGACSELLEKRKRRAGSKDSKRRRKKERREANTPVEGLFDSDEERAASQSIPPDSQDPLPLTRDALHDVLQHLRERNLPDGEVALRLVAQARSHLQKHCSSLVRLPSPSVRLIVVGDLHGHLNDLLHILEVYGDPCQSTAYLFNGDFVDKGVWGPEVLLILFCLLLLYPAYVNINRGNHESWTCNDRYGFREHLMHAFPEYHIDLYSWIHASFRCMPLCTLIGEKVCVMHGGLPLEPVSLSEIEAIPRGSVPLGSQLDKKADRIFQALLWSDPSKHAGPNKKRCVGWCFTQQHTEEFLKSNNLSCIVRSHENIPTGFQRTHDGLITTVFSASNYYRQNSGSVATIDNCLQVMQGITWNKPHEHSHHRESLSKKSFTEKMNARKVFVTNLPCSVTEKEIRDWLSSHGCGRISHVFCGKGRNTIEDAGYAHIQFDSVSSASQAIQECDNTEIHKRVVRVALAKKGEKIQFELPTNLRVAIRELMHGAPNGQDAYEGKNISMIRDALHRQHGKERFDVTRWGFKSFSSAMLTVGGVCLEYTSRTVLLAFFEGSAQDPRSTKHLKMLNGSSDLC
eukprot:TRINITY_DN30080_c0_g1_i2.p1 TRINITY_DN30080_c0_g1~~TRINITY_DN30080_c0_g1_i2.p1  ORF type:complete len:593 (+),score=71.86 TRINITY_DN30080_c0_g1_i2:83-1861(+)